MQICPNCQKENPDSEAYCYSCGHILPHGLPDSIPATGEVDTANLYDLLEPQRRWGTAYFNRNHKLEFAFRDLNQSLTIVVQDRVVVGRLHNGPSVAPPDVDLGPYGAMEAGVSRRHLALVRGHNTISVEDLGSANSTHLNGQRLIPHELRILRDNDELRLGRLIVRVSFV